MGFDYASKIQALIANAEDETLSDDTRAMYRAKAEELMVKYRIVEEEALATNDAGASEPIAVDIVLNARDSDLSMWYRSVFATIAHHTGVRVHMRNQRREHTDDTGRVARVTYDLVATVVGYEGDVRYAEYLWTAAYMMFSTRVDPVWDDARSESENIYLLRNAGLERKRIANRAWGNGDLPAARSKVQRIYTRECERRGETPRAAGLSHDTATYREAYARSFRDTLARRLQDARDAADSVHGAITLHGRSERVDEAFYARFPMYRPSDAPAAPVAPCEKCKPGKPCRLHRWTASDERAYQRRYNSPSAQAGDASGRAAADSVTIARGHTRAQRLDRSGGAIEG